MNQAYNTDFLTPTSSFITGAGSIFNFMGDDTPYNSSDSGEKADVKAIFMDWAMVGQDLQISIDNFNNEKIQDGEKQK